MRTELILEAIEVLETIYVTVGARAYSHVICM